MTPSICPPGAAEFGCWFEEPQTEFSAGRYCAARALRLIGVKDSAPIGRSADGLPLWPRGIVGSISHTREFAWSAVAWQTAVRGLGVDAEPVMSDRRARVIESRIGSRREIAAIVSAGSFDHRTAMTVAFCAKEAIFKCLYSEAGRVFDFRDVRLEATDASSGRMAARLTTTLSPGLRRGFRIDARYRVEEGYVFASASY